MISTPPIIVLFAVEPEILISYIDVDMLSKFVMPDNKFDDVTSVGIELVILNVVLIDGVLTKSRYEPDVRL